MERGKPDQTVYTFEVPKGGTMAYPDSELWTRDYNEADQYAQAHGYLLIASEYEFEDSNLVEDYATETCDECGANLADDEGEVYGGLCGACAGKAEAEGRWSQ